MKLSDLSSDQFKRLVMERLGGNSRDPAGAKFTFDPNTNISTRISDTPIDINGKFGNKNVSDVPRLPINNLTIDGKAEPLPSIQNEVGRSFNADPIPNAVNIPDIQIPTIKEQGIINDASNQQLSQDIEKQNLTDILSASLSEGTSRDSALSSSMLTDFIIRGNLNAAGIPVKPSLSKEVIASQGGDISATKLLQDQNFGEAGLSLSKDKLDLNKFLGKGDLGIKKQNILARLRELGSINLARKNKLKLDKQSSAANILIKAAGLLDSKQNKNKSFESILSTLAKENAGLLSEASSEEKTLLMNELIKTARKLSSGR